MSYFEAIAPVRYEGPDTQQSLAFRHYDANRKVLGRTMAEHLRFSACYWHNFVWPGLDMFGQPMFDRPWFSGGSPMDQALAKADAAFDFFSRLGVPFYTFHDTDVIPPSDRIGDYVENFARLVDVLESKQAETGLRLLWGTANLFSHPRYAAGAATSPQPEVFAFAATQVAHAMAATQRLGGENYVLWGGREGYETLLNTDLKRERQQAGRFLSMAVEHKHRLGFAGDILIEPKPQEPTKHQYDYDVATVYGFLKDFGLENEVRVNIEANHATLAGHSFHHEVATAIALGIFGSVDANRGDPQNGWDTDQFPNSVEECTLVMYEILKAGGFQRGGFNFDTKIRRQSTSPADLFHGHVGAMDVMALALERAARMVENDVLGELKARRYAGWDSDYGRGLLADSASLQGIAEAAIEGDIAPQHVSGEQERLENLVTRFIYG